MKTRDYRKSLPAIAACAAVVLAGGAMVPSHQANAAGPQIVEIKAKKFDFSPAEIVLKKSEPVILRLTSEDRIHGFLIKPLNVDADIAPGHPTDISLVPNTAGEYVVICDHYCGIGHGNMKMKVTVR